MRDRIPAVHRYQWRGQAKQETNSGRPLLKRANPAQTPSLLCSCLAYLLHTSNEKLARDVCGAIQGALESCGSKLNAAVQVVSKANKGKAL